ncbi:MAG: pyridoxamine 5'-phosphate oxidase family protein [Bdellovibrio sp.]
MKTETQYSFTESIKKLGELIKNVKFAMLTTTNSLGQLRSCPLTVQEVDVDGDIWFLINKNSEAFAHLTKDPRVNVSFSSEKKYVSVSGKGEFIDDKDKLQTLWDSSLKIWFPEGVEDPNIVILRINVENAEYWQHPTYKVVQLAALAKSFITGEKEHRSEHQKLDLH